MKWFVIAVKGSDGIIAFRFPSGSKRSEFISTIEKLGPFSYVTTEIVEED